MSLMTEQFRAQSFLRDQAERHRVVFTGFDLHWKTEMVE